MQIQQQVVLNCIQKDTKTTHDDQVCFSQECVFYLISNVHVSKEKENLALKKSHENPHKLG